MAVADVAMVGLMECGGSWSDGDRECGVGGMGGVGEDGVGDWQSWYECVLVPVVISMMIAGHDQCWCVYTVYP